MKTIIIDGIEYNLTPKALFKKGDWVRAISSGNIFKILSVNDGLYRVLCYDGVEANYPIEDVEKDLAYWTIQDAKVGDVLEFADHGRLVIGIVSHVNKLTGKVDVNCLLEGNNFKLGNYYALDTINPHPGTKEQCDLLFAKMKEAGYEWDAEKKELRKIEQNPVDNRFTPEQANVLDKHIDNFLEQNPTWGEEDEKFLKLSLENLSDLMIEFGEKHGKVGDCINWLKSIKERMKGE